MTHGPGMHDLDKDYGEPFADLNNLASAPMSEKVRTVANFIEDKPENVEIVMQAVETDANTRNALKSLIRSGGKDSGLGTLIHACMMDCAYEMIITEDF